MKKFPACQNGNETAFPVNLPLQTILHWKQDEITAFLTSGCVHYLPAMKNNFQFAVEWKSLLSIDSNQHHHNQEKYVLHNVAGLQTFHLLPVLKCRDDNTCYNQTKSLAH